MSVVFSMANIPTGFMEIAKMSIKQAGIKSKVFIETSVDINLILAICQ